MDKKKISNVIKSLEKIEMITTMPIEIDDVNAILGICEDLLNDLGKLENDIANTKEKIVDVMSILEKASI